MHLKIEFKIWKFAVLHLLRLSTLSDNNSNNTQTEEIIVIHTNRGIIFSLRK